MKTAIFSCLLLFAGIACTAAERARLVKRIQNRGADEFRLVRYLVQSRKHLAFRLEGNDSLFFLTHDSLHLFNRLKVIQSNTIVK